MRIVDCVGFFLIHSDPAGGFCAGGITENADPSMKKQLKAEMASMGLPLLSIAAEKAPDSATELSRLYEKGKQA